MINATIEAIAAALHAEYPNIDNEIEELEQGFESPCFFITSLSPSRSEVVGNMYTFDGTYIVQYFPKEGKAEINDVVDTLNTILDCITINGKLTWRKSMTSETTDNVLTCTVRYADQYYIPESGDDMESLTINTEGEQ